MAKPTEAQFEAYKLKLAAVGAPYGDLKAITVHIDEIEARGLTFDEIPEAAWDRINAERATLETALKDAAEDL